LDSASDWSAFFSGTLVSSINKIDRHDIAEIFSVESALSNITININHHQKMHCKVLSSHGLIKDIDSHWGTWAVQIKYNITFQAAIT
jgi:hypothetical protein